MSAFVFLVTLQLSKRLLYHSCEVTQKSVNKCIPTIWKIKSVKVDSTSVTVYFLSSSIFYLHLYICENSAWSYKKKRKGKERKRKTEHCVCLHADSTWISLTGNWKQRKERNSSLIGMMEYNWQKVFYSQYIISFTSSPPRPFLNCVLWALFQTGPLVWGKSFIVE